MESLKELVQVTPSVKCLINQTTMEMNLQGTNKISNQTILTQKTLINREVSLLVAEVATEDLRVVPEVLEDPVWVEETLEEIDLDLALGITEDQEVLTMTVEDSLHVKIEEILILKLSHKSTLRESTEIKVKRISRSISLNSERLRISLWKTSMPLLTTRITNLPLTLSKNLTEPMSSAMIRSPCNNQVCKLYDDSIWLYHELPDLFFFLLILLLTYFCSTDWL